MRTLFVKLFLWFWLASTVSGLVSFMLAYNPRIQSRQQRQAHHLRHAQPLIQTLSLYGRVASAGFEREGVVPAFGDGVPGNVSVQLFLGDGAPLTGEVPPAVIAAVRTFAADVVSDGTPLLSRFDDKELVAVRVKGPSGRHYIAAGTVTLPPHQHHPFGFFPIPPDIWFRIGVSIFIGGVACYVLAWWIASPIRQLRTVAQKLADGDLSSRVQLKVVVGRNEEMTDLGRDFNRMAERIENLVSAHQRLVRDVSHELRSPLARLNVALGLARREDAGEVRSALDRIELEAERLNSLIGELLTLSLLDGNGESLVKTPFSLDEVVAEVVHDADFEAVSRNRRVVLTASSPATLCGNRKMVRHALENIVRNAVHYTEEGSAVEVSLTHDVSGQSVIRVRDHGPGVPESALTDIFRPFYRVAGDRDRHSGGAGIGLAIAERTVHLSGGIITARNVPGGGLEMEVRLPLST